MEPHEALKRFRGDMKLTMAGIAEQLDMKPQAYYRYEKGTYLLPTAALLKLATTYGVTTDYLLGLSDEPRPPDTAALVKAIGECQKILSDALDVHP